MAFNPPTTAPQFISGDQCMLKFAVLGSDGTTFGTSIQLPARDWNMSLKGNNKDVSNGRDGRFRIAGLVDMDGDLKMPYDTANDPAAAGMKPGAIIQGKFYVNATKFYEAQIIVDEIGPGTEFEGELMFPIKFSLQLGSTLTYPASS